MNFNNRTALVTGTAVGIGRATAIKLAANGANVVLVDLNEDKLESVRREIQVHTENVMAIRCDVSNEEEVIKAAAKAEGAFGHIDILVNNAALWRSSHAFTDIETQEWKQFIDVNVMGTVYFTKALLPAMLKNRYGRIINVASVAGVYGNANMVHYSATKGAVIAMTKALAKEVTSEGVLVNAVSPGSVSPADNPDMDYYQDSKLSFMGRTGTDNENAELICFLASDAASYISGQNIQIDGCRKKQ